MRYYYITARDPHEIDIRKFLTLEDAKREAAITYGDRPWIVWLVTGSREISAYSPIDRRP